MKTIVEIGGEKEKGKKTIVLEDMYPLFKKAKDSKDTGGIHDFVEILKLYDKNSDKTMLSKDLFRLLTNLGNFGLNSNDLTHQIQSPILKMRIFTNCLTI